MVLAYAGALALLLIFCVGLAVTLRFAFWLFVQMLDINARAHQEIQQLNARRRR